MAWLGATEKLVSLLATPIEESDILRHHTPEYVARVRSIGVDHDPNVLTISIHQDGNYPPRSGGMADTGEGAGAGYNINVPLPPGSGHGAYRETITRVVIPALHAYRPELIMVASGLDASTMDPLARMMCYSETYRLMTRMLKSRGSMIPH